MQTSQRRVPVGGDNGNFKTWTDMIPVYEEELEALKMNIERLKSPQAAASTVITAAAPAAVTLFHAGSPAAMTNNSDGASVPFAALPMQQKTPPTALLARGALLFENRQERIDSVAPELRRLSGIVLNRDTTRISGTTIVFQCDKPVKLLVGFFHDDDPKWAKPPKLETDATGNEYGQAEPILTNAIAMTNMPPVNIHAYHFDKGRHTINLPKGIIMVAGFTSDDIRPRDVRLMGAGDDVDWLFMK